MKLSELMAGITPVPEYEGPVSADDYVLAIGLEGTETKPDDYLVAQEGITEHSGALSAVTNDVTYIRSGPQNVKTGTTRTINLTGDRYAGDAFQDALLAHKIKYGTAAALSMEENADANMPEPRTEKKKVRKTADDEVAGP